MGIEEQLPSGFVLTNLEKFVNYSRSKSLWPATFGLACCAIEMMTTGGPQHDISRFGMEVFRASPRQADLMIVAGRVSQKMAPVLRRIYDQMSDPKWVLSMGVCATSGGMFNNYALVQGVDHIVPVDMYVPRLPAAARRCCSTGSCSCTPRSRTRRSPSRERADMPGAANRHGDANPTGPDPPRGSRRRSATTGSSRSSPRRSRRSRHEVVLGELTFYADADELVGLLRLARDDERLRCRLLSDLAGVHWPSGETGHRPPALDDRVARVPRRARDRRHRGQLRRAVARAQPRLPGRVATDDVEPRLPSVTGLFPGPTGRARGLRHVRRRVRRPPGPLAHPDAGRLARPPAPQGLPPGRCGRRVQERQAHPAATRARAARGRRRGAARSAAAPAADLATTDEARHGQGTRS